MANKPRRAVAPDERQMAIQRVIRPRRFATRLGPLYWSRGQSICGKPNKNPRTGHLVLLVWYGCMAVYCIGIRVLSFHGSREINGSRSHAGSFKLKDPISASIEVGHADRCRQSADKNQQTNELFEPGRVTQRCTDNMDR